MLEFLNKINLLSKKIGFPFFIYDLDGFKKHLKFIKKFPVRIWYAVKANPLSNFLFIINKSMISFDTASLGELEQVFSISIHTNRILATGPAKSFHYLMYYIFKGIRIFIIESPHQLNNLNKLNCLKIFIKIHILLRIQLNWSQKGSNVLGGDSVSPFGVSFNSWKINICFFKLKYNFQVKIKIIGLHCFQWGNLLNYKEIYDIWYITITKLLNFSYELGLSCHVVDLGGGLGIDYTGFRTLFLYEIYNILNIFLEKYNKIIYWLELGRYFVSSNGFFNCKVIDNKNTFDTNLIVLEGGLNNLARPLLAKENFPLFFTKKNGLKKTYNIHGPLCTSLDILSPLILSTNLVITGNNLTFFNVGAYGFTESLPFFLCHNISSEIIIYKKKIKVVRQSKKSNFWTV